ncbi:MAG: hypothetical protein QXP01_06745 [Candidatus Hadarchaeum sp.]
MPLQTAAGYPQLASLASPEVWSPLLLEAFNEKTIVPEITSRDYIGEITDVGCKVYVRTVPAIASKPYTKGQAIVPEFIEPGLVEVEIDKASYWCFAIDDIDRFQSDIDYLKAWTRAAAESQRVYVDSVVLADIYDEAASTNKGTAAGAKSQNINLGAVGNPLALDADNIIEFILNCGVVLDETNTPDDDRYIVLPPSLVALLKSSDVKSAAVMGDAQSVLRTDKIGVLDRFTIYKSNLLSSQTESGARCWNVIFGHKSAVAFASQFVKSQLFDKVESGFFAMARGLQVFGYKVVRPEQLGWAYVKIASP